MLCASIGATASCRADDADAPAPGSVVGNEPGAADDAVSEAVLAEECLLAGVALTPPSQTSTRGRVVIPDAVSLVAVGDSLTFGQASTHPGGDTSYPAVLGRILGVPTINRGIPGHGTRDLPDVDYLLAEGKQNRLVVMVGTNDIHNGLGGTASEIYARLAAYVAAREAAGWLVTVNTPPRWLAATPETDRVAIEYEGLIRRGFRHVADIAASPVIGRGSAAGPDRAYYGDENGHLNDAGYATLAKIVGESIPPRGREPSIDRPLGVVRNKSLTGWFRDWVQCSALPGEMERPTRWLDMTADAPGDVLGEGFDAFGRERPVRIPNAIHGRPALRFNGPGSGFYVPPRRLTNQFVRSRDLAISVVVQVDGVATVGTAPYEHDGFFSDGKTRLGMGIRQPNTVVAFTYDGTQWFSRESPMPVGVPVVVSMRLFRGKLGLRVGTDGAWAETEAPKIDSLSSDLRIGTDSTNQRTMSGMIADLVVRRSYCEATMASDDAYFRARYGVR